MKEVIINNNQELYVIPCGTGITCLGFDVCLEKGKRLSKELGRVAYPYEECRGTLSAYLRLQYLLNVVKLKNQKTGYRSESELHPQLMGYEGWRVEVLDQDDRTYRFIVGKSTGYIPCHLGLKRKDSSGGECVDSRPFKRVTLIRKVK